jgi:hypothetical protein
MQKHIDNGGEFSPADSVKKYDKIESRTFIDSINEGDVGRTQHAKELADQSDEAYQKALKYRRMVRNAKKRMKPK